MKWFIRRRCDCDGAICLAWLRHKARSLGRDNMGAIQSILASGVYALNWYRGFVLSRELW